MNRIEQFGDEENDIRYDSLMVTPLVDIYAISLHKGAEKLEIYGRVKVVDMSGDDFDLFVRGKDEPECIDNDATLLLSSPGVNVIVPSEYVIVDVCLLDKARDDMVVAKGQFSLDVFSLDCVEKRMLKDVGIARVHYSLVPFAVVANVDVLYFSKDDEFDVLNDDAKNPYVTQCGYNYDYDYFCERFDKAVYIEHDALELVEYESNVVNVFGTVKANSGNFDPKDCVLFKTTSEQSVPTRSRSFFTLSRSVVAVPANSLLKIEVDLYDRDTQLPICSNTLEFKPQDRLTYKKDIVGENGRIRVRVTWNHAYEQRYKRKMRRSYELGVSPDIKSVSEEQRLKLFSREESLLSMAPSSTLYAKPNISSSPTPAAEVFSVVVCSKTFEPLSFYGSITVNSCDYILFLNNATSPRHCPGFGTDVEVNCCGSFNFFIGDFSLWAVLRDINGSSIVNGYIAWRPHEIINNEMAEKRMCSIIGGDTGFCIVYYSVFMDALAAEVSVKLHGNALSNRVYGKLVARYSCYNYSSSYDKKYYQSILFNKDAEEAPTLVTPHDCGIPLLKSFVAAPRASFLILEADLNVVPLNVVDDNFPRETLSLQGCIAFEVADGLFVRRIVGHNVHIEVSVNVSHVC